MPVVPAVEGDPAPGFVVGRVTADPASVEIVGPDSRVRQVAEATTEPVSVKDARARVRDGVTVGVVDSVGAAGAGPERAGDGRDLAGAGRAQSSPTCPVRYRNLGTGLRAQLSPAARPGDASAARRSAQRRFARDSVQAFVDLAGLGSGRYNLRVQVDPAESFGVFGIEPASSSVVSQVRYPFN